MTTERTPADGRRPGLREQKKRATREALTLAALRLALERGLDNVRVEDIAAEVQVTTRTFNNYFSTKYEALVARHVDRVRQSAEALRARPAGEPLWEAVTQAVLSPLVEADRAHESPDPEVLGGIRLIATEPALQAEALKAALTADGELAAAVAERTGTDPGRDMYPRLVAGSVATAVHVATDQWLRADPPVPLVLLLREALRQVAAGLPAPPAGPSH
ncbi:TetR family transcriptional regulator [Nonomuraea roseoviolacea]|uniref:AcrR family transcriptional regulator n=1 Tax=Nonomuraea roseoviolacea subsp. carminata TaxID=160689 RepID=A0ABT1K0M2_9ACTN|nr:TetR family transcriptional regulator [Nonomuraea roseoviolacea]MCP2347548.1 AcrR family transcriptional regulator [Nonomuraea roseoviolacea subsp. carminata]